MQERAVRLQKVSLTRATVHLAPQAAAEMAVGAQVAQPQPASIVTAHIGTKMPRGIDGTWVSVARRHRHGTYRRGRLRLGGGGVFTVGAMVPVLEAFEGL